MSERTRHQRALARKVLDSRDSGLSTVRMMLRDALGREEEADARIAAETKRADDAEAERDRLAELLRKALPVLRLLAGSERSWLDNGDYCGAPDYTLADSGDEHATRIDAALAEMERNK